MTPVSTGLVVNCTGNHQPHAQTLADQFGVSYDEIMGWFCQGFGFGVIKQIYELGHQKNIPVAELFARKANGAGMGDLKREDDVIVNNKRNSSNNGNNSNRSRSHRP